VGLSPRYKPILEEEAELEKTAKNIGANKVAFISKRGKQVFEEKLNFKTCGIYFCKELKEE